jgi:hypothetical protein
MEIRARRGPFTDPREGRLLRVISNCFTAYNVDVLRSDILVDWCHGAKAIRRLEGSPSWHRETVKRALLKVATPVGRSPKGKGRPMLWRLDPEKAAQYGWRKKEKRMTGKAPPAVL